MSHSLDPVLTPCTVDILQRASGVYFDTSGQFWSVDPTDMLKGHKSHVDRSTLTPTPDLYKSTVIRIFSQRD